MRVNQAALDALIDALGPASDDVLASIEETHGPLIERLPIPGLNLNAAGLHLLKERGAPRVDDLITDFLRVIIRDYLPEAWEAIEPIHGNIGEREL